MRSMANRRWRLLTGLTFLAPNILGFLAFTLIPLVFSLAMAFSNWDLKQHNLFRPQARIRFVGLENFAELLTGSDFWKFLGNTLFLMIGLPFGIAASLCAALLLSKDLGRGSLRTQVALIAGAVLLSSTIFLSAMGAAAAPMTLLLIGVVGGILVLGTAVGTGAYRTLLYMPSFTSGVATFLLWKKFYNPRSGPIDLALAGPLRTLGDIVNYSPAWLFSGVGYWAFVLLAAALLGYGLVRIVRAMTARSLAARAAAIPIFLLLIPAMVFVPDNFESVANVKPLLRIAIVAILTACLLAAGRIRGQSFDEETIPREKWEGAGDAFVFSAAVMIGQFILLGLAQVLGGLPAMAQSGLEPPAWLSEYQWAKPAMMLMAFWAAIGSNTMLLYLAALTNVPAELYEAADIDGASRFARFWNVTWPQLAPTTFFIVVMGMIGGLQSGFEIARVMTNGGPAGSTTTLSYFIYTEGFETGRLGFASAIAWSMFALVFLLTLFNWTLGSKYVND